MRLRKKFTFKYIFIIFIASVLLLSVGYSLLSENLLIEGKGNLVITDPEKEDYTVTYTKETWYSGKHHYNFNLVLTNNTEPIYEWVIVVNVPNDTTITNCWNATCEVENGQLKITNLSYNGFVNTNASINLGVSLTTNTAQLELNNFEVQQPDEEVEGDKEIAGLTATLVKGNSWQSGNQYVTQYDLKVKNNSTINIKNWKVKIKLNSATVANYWNLQVEIVGDYLYLSNVAYNGNINIGGEAGGGLQLMTPTANHNFVIQSVTTN